MSNLTKNYKLLKPLGSDNYNVEHQNQNMDIIDEKVKELSDACANSVKADGTLQTNLNAEMVGGISKDRIIYGDQEDGTVYWAKGIDNINKSGFYGIYQNLSNIPFMSPCICLHEALGDRNARQTITYIGERDLCILTRRKIENTWEKWTSLGDPKSLDGHPASYFLPASAYNSRDILNKLKTVDGSGSGLDADKLDGVQASQFLRSDAPECKTAGNLTFNDNVAAKFGTSGDLGIYHDGANNYFRSYKHGATTYIQGENASGTNKNMIIADPDNAVSLYYAGAKKVETKSDGINVTGNIYNDGTMQLNTRLNNGKPEYYNTAKGRWEAMGGASMIEFQNIIRGSYSAISNVNDYKEHENAKFKILSVNGEGLFLYFKAMCSSDSRHQPYNMLKLYVDGVLKTTLRGDRDNSVNVEMDTYGSVKSAGIKKDGYDKEKKYILTEGYDLNVERDSFYNYLPSELCPTGEYNDIKLIILPYPIYFKKSLIIEASYAPHDVGRGEIIIDWKYAIK